MLELKSKLILTVHDSIVVDCHPDELEVVKKILTWSMTGVKDELKERFNYDMVLPLDIEISAGPNWMEMQELALD
jgi:DNA polymerase-1